MLSTRDSFRGTTPCLLSQRELSREVVMSFFGKFGGPDRHVHLRRESGVCSHHGKIYVIRYKSKKPCESEPNLVVSLREIRWTSLIRAQVVGLSTSLS